MGRTDEGSPLVLGYGGVGQWPAGELGIIDVLTFVPSRLW